MKIVWHTIMMVNSFTFLPGFFVFLIYSMGATVLLGQWHLFVWALAGFIPSVIAQAGLAIFSE